MPKLSLRAILYERDSVYQSKESLIIRETANRVNEAGAEGSTKNNRILQKP